MQLKFVETKTFTRKLFKVWNEESYLELQDVLLANPDIGDIIPNGDGIRKIRRVQADAERAAEFELYIFGP